MEYVELDDEDALDDDALSRLGIEEYTEVRTQHTNLTSPFVTGGRVLDGFQTFPELLRVYGDTVITGNLDVQGSINNTTTSLSSYDTRLEESERRIEELEQRLQRLEQQTFRL